MDRFRRGKCCAMKTHVRVKPATCIIRPSVPPIFLAPEHHSIIMPPPRQEQTPLRSSVPALAALSDDVRRGRKRADGYSGAGRPV